MDTERQLGNSRRSAHGPRMVWQPRKTALPQSSPANSIDNGVIETTAGSQRPAQDNNDAEIIRGSAEVSNNPSGTPEQTPDRMDISAEAVTVTQRIEEGKIEAKVRVDEWRRHRLEIFETRKLNLKASKAPSVLLSKSLDSSIKKTSAFLRKLRSFSLGGDAQVKSLISELDRLNLSRYGSEMVSAIVDSRLVRSADVAAAIQISSAIHKLYPQFASDLETGLTHIFDNVPQSAKKSEIEKEYASKWRTTLKLLTDLFRYGVFQTPKSVSSAIKQLIDGDLGHDPSCTILSILVGFCRYAGFDFLGLLPSKVEADFALVGESAELLPNEASDPIIEPDIQDKCRALFNRYFDNLVVRFSAVERDIANQRKDNRRQDFYKGAVEEVSIANLNLLTERYDSLKLHLGQFADLLHRELIETSMDEEEEFIKSSFEDGAIENTNANSFFDDDETHVFYTALPNLSLMIPAVLLGDSKADNAQPEPVVIDDRDFADDADLADTTTTAPKVLSPFDLFLQRLPDAMNRTQIDELAESFCYLNNRGTRKRLIEAIYRVNRSRIDLLPYLSRLVAVLTPCFPDIGSEVVRLLKNQFYGLMRHKSQHNIELKVRNVRFIGELVKFGVAHHSLAFNAWNFCLNEFTGQRIPVACALLEVCGRWLFKNPETNERCLQFLDRMMKLKTSKYIEEHFNNLIENAYYQCNPPAIRIRPRKLRQPIQSYIRRLIYAELNESTVDQVLSLLRKLPWNDESVAKYVKVTLFRADRVQTQNIKYLASIVSGLDKYYSVAIEIADCVLEEIRAGLERNYFIESQRRLAFVRFLAELYNYMVVNAQTIFDTLYMIITLGHEIGRIGQLISHMDPPTDTFRVRVICVLLDGCGSYFSSGSKKKRLERFFIFLQRYLILKTVVPADVDFMVADLFDSLTPRLPKYKTLVDVDQAIARLDKGNVDRLIQLQGSQTTPLKAGTSSQVEPESDAAASEDDGDSSLQEDMSDQSGDVVDEGEDESHDFDRWDRHKGAAQRSDDNIKAFDLEFERMVLESVEQRKFEKRTVQNLTDASVFDKIAKPSTRDDGSSVMFHVLTKRANKTQAKVLAIPSEVGLAAKTLVEKQMAIEEQKAIRRLVIAGMQREHAEEQKNGTLEFDRQLEVDLSYRNFDPKSISLSNSSRQRYGRGSNSRRGTPGRGGSIQSDSVGSR